MWGGGGVEEDFLEKGTSEARPKGRIGAIREGVTSEAPGSSLSATVTDTPLRWALFWLQGGPAEAAASPVLLIPLPHADPGASPPPSCSSRSFPFSPPTQKLFVVPADESQARIPYARVNHNKYMVTERATYIGECPEHRQGDRRGGLAQLRALTLCPPPQEPLTGLAATSRRRRAPRCW